MIKFNKTFICMLVASSLFAGCAKNANDSFSKHNIKKEDTIKLIEENFKKGNIELNGLEVHPTEIPSIYRLSAEGHPDAYVTKDGKYIISGLILNIKAERPYEVNAKAKSDQNTKIIKGIPKQYITSYKAEGKEVTHLNVFFDPLCPYCKMFFAEIPEVVKLGVTVNLIPLANSDEQKAIASKIACAPDKNAAMDLAVSGKSLPDLKCEVNFDEINSAALSVEATGTPSIYTEDGIKIGGSLTVNNIKSILTELKFLKEDQKPVDESTSSEPK